jgi:hypothetical protein
MTAQLIRALADTFTANAALLRALADQVSRQDNIKDEPIPSDDEMDFRAAKWAANIAPVPSYKLPEPSLPHSGQNEGESGESPEHGSDDGGPALAGQVTPKSLQFVTLSGAGEGVRTAPELHSAADDEILPTRPRSRGLAGEKSLAKTTQLIEPGDLIGVDIRQCLVHGPKGSWSLDGRVKMARALDLLKSGDIFEFAHIARVAQWQDGAAAQRALLTEAISLPKHGLRLSCDILNARLVRS